MIKLIATDMDGTFLKDDKTFSQDFFKTYDNMKKEGIKFVIASGNQYHLLYQKFLPISSELIYIAENGSLIVNGTDIIFKDVITKSNLQYLNQLLSSYDDIIVIYCGLKNAYIDIQYKPYEKNFIRYYHHYQYVNSLENIDDQIIKLAIFSKDKNNIKLFDDLRAKLSSDLRIVSSGNHWMDIQNNTSNKGIALKKVQEMFHISKDECMAFGDQMNDYELLQSVKYGYAMQNAIQPIKDIAYDICLDNNQQGVILKINEYLDK